MIKTLDITQPTLSHHVKILSDAKLINVQKEGKYSYFTINEEKILIASRSTNTLTASSRGYDGVVAVAHNSGATVDHILDATSIQDMNTTTYDTQVLLWVGI